MNKQKLIFNTFAIISVLLIVASLTFICMAISTANIANNLGWLIMFSVLLLFAIIYLIVLFSKINNLKKYKNKVVNSLIKINKYLDLRATCSSKIILCVKSYQKDNEILASIENLQKEIISSKTEEEKIKKSNDMFNLLKNFNTTMLKNSRLKKDGLFVAASCEYESVEIFLALLNKYYIASANFYNNLIKNNFTFANAYGFYVIPKLNIFTI